MFAFRCSMFWAFSLLKPSDTLLWLEMCFDAQRFELFLYIHAKADLKKPQFCFDAQCSELFLYKFRIQYLSQKKTVSMLNVLSFFFIILQKVLLNCIVIQLSMLNVLSFFFMRRMSVLLFRRLSISMLNVLSFLFMVVINTYDIKEIRPFRCSTFWAFSLSPQTMGSAITYYKRFRCSMFWAFSLFLERLADKLYCYRVSMLNVLSFFFIVLLVVVRPLTTVFRCSTFWAFSLLPYWGIITRQKSENFDAQRFELFLY